MATLRPIDLRTSAEREGITKAQQTAQALNNILQTIGQAEQARQERQTLSRIATAIAGGATTIEAISAVAKQKAQFSGGLPGMVQRIGSAFQPSPGGIERGIHENVIGSRLRQILNPALLSPQEEKEIKLYGQRERAPGLTEIQKLTKQGYNPKEAKEILDIKHGLKPRSSARLQYEEMSEVEKLKYLTTEKAKAEGQYFGLEGMKEGPRDPQALAWANSELEKLSIYRKDGKKTEKLSMPPPPDNKILEAAIGPENARMETKAWGVIYGLWDKLSEGVRNKIRQESLSGGKSFTELLNEPDIRAEVEAAVGKSPYKEYPDAFQEDGIWKVMKDGKKYRIED